MAKLGSKSGCNRTRYHLVHRVVGVVALGVCAADPRRFQQFFLLFLLVGLLLLSVVLRTRLLGLSTPDGEAAPLRKGLLWISVPGRDKTSLSAQTGRALGPAVSLLLPTAPLPVSTRRSTEESRRRLGPPPPPANTPDADRTGWMTPTCVASSCVGQVTGTSCCLCGDTSPWKQTLSSETSPPH